MPSEHRPSRASCRVRTGNLLGTGEPRLSSCAKEAGRKCRGALGGAVTPADALPMACPAVRGSSCAEQRATLSAAALPVSSGGFEPPLPRYSGACLLPLGYEDMRAPDPDRTGDLVAYEATALAD
jgi:hypothetical protein